MTEPTRKKILYEVLCIEENDQLFKIFMEKLAHKALIAVQKKHIMGEYFNKLSSIRNFNVDHQVILLIPDSMNNVRFADSSEILRHHLESFAFSSRTTIGE
ncbi:hypothetical protein CEXT_575811 [Caerostris extrusa]|uniref:Uncharacterized protein n=1 Tax=Caerostris extrusa TaxID=172846 RepID=A0AAV4XHI8_CAEEX|nr:hypothetical protein CEXT_575811 [Caerostris extrusa]